MWGQEDAGSLRLARSQAALHGRADPERELHQRSVRYTRRPRELTPPTGVVTPRRVVGDVDDFLSLGLNDLALHRPGARSSSVPGAARCVDAFYDHMNPVGMGRVMVGRRSVTPTSTSVARRSSALTGAAKQRQAAEGRGASQSPAALRGARLFSNPVSSPSPQPQHRRHAPAASPNAVRRTSSQGMCTHTRRALQRRANSPRGCARTKADCLFSASIPPGPPSSPSPRAALRRATPPRAHATHPATLSTEAPEPAAPPKAASLRLKFHRASPEARGHAVQEIARPALRPQTLQAGVAPPRLPLSEGPVGKEEEEVPTGANRALEAQPQHEQAAPPIKGHPNPVPLDEALQTSFDGGDGRRFTSAVGENSGPLSLADTARSTDLPIIDGVEECTSSGPASPAHVPSRTESMASMCRAPPRQVLAAKYAAPGKYHDEFAARFGNDALAKEEQEGRKKGWGGARAAAFLTWETKALQARREEKEASATYKKGERGERKPKIETGRVRAVSPRGFAKRVASPTLTKPDLPSPSTFWFCTPSSA